MQITQNYPIITYNHAKNQPQTHKMYDVPFQGVRFDAASEKGLQKIEYVMRIVGNKFADLFEGGFSKYITEIISRVKPEQNRRYLNILEEISNNYSTSRRVGCNVEDKVLERIAKRGKPVIFIMTHSNQAEDPQMLALLNQLLVQAYKAAGSDNTFPLPKIILNQDILRTMNPTKRKAFEAFGAVGIDANISSANTGTNVRAFLPLVKDFIRGKCNIFIFPEGRLAIKKYLPLEQRFQIGVAEIINKVLGIKKEVDVIPVGFAYGSGKNKQLAGMHIGEPITFRRIGDSTTITAGEIKDSEYASSGFVDFFEKHKDQTDVVITDSGQPVKSAEISDWIRELLSENLFVSQKKAEKNILNPQNDEIVKVCVTD